MDVPEGLIRANNSNIELNQTPITSNEPQRLKLYIMYTLTQKIKLWLIVCLFR